MIDDGKPVVMTQICTACGADMVCLDHGLSLPCDMCLAEGATSSLLCGCCGGVESREVSQAERLALLEQELNPQAGKLRALQNSAEEGRSTAQFELGQMYWSGAEGARDITNSVKLVRMAAEQGLAEAQLFLAKLYLHGDGVRKNAPDALKWLQKAASQNFSDAQFEFGLLLMEGQGSVQPDLEKATHWLNLAAKLGHKDAKALLETLKPEPMYEVDDDTLYPQAVKIVVDSGRSSISLVQRTLGIGYNRAARLIEKMEEQGIVSAMRADGSRIILIHPEKSSICTGDGGGDIPTIAGSADVDIKSNRSPIWVLIASIFFGLSVIAGPYLGLKFWIAACIISLIIYIVFGKKFSTLNKRVLGSICSGIVATSLIFIIGGLVSSVTTKNKNLDSPIVETKFIEVANKNYNLDAFFSALENNELDSADEKYSLAVDEYLLQKNHEIKLYSRILTATLDLVERDIAQNKVIKAQSILLIAENKLLNGQKQPANLSTTSRSIECQIQSLLASLYWDRRNYPAAIIHAQHATSVSFPIADNKVYISINHANQVLANALLLNMQLSDAVKAYKSIQLDLLPKEERLFTILLQQVAKNKSNIMVIDSQPDLSFNNYTNFEIDGAIKLIRDATTGNIQTESFARMAEEIVRSNSSPVISSSRVSDFIGNQQFLPKYIGWLGVQIGHKINTDSAGALITSVEFGSPADHAGIHSGDYILEIDRELIFDYPTVRAAVDRLKVGQIVVVKLLRDGRSQNRDVKIESRP